ncbi:hypothetical protein SAMN05216355_102113 [Actinomyces ruminicola]|uniref:Uncharacterized protein n=2 Tax=Actinomyces ruminicola TaxID=332524 RepID=A0A1H0ATY6_9ACTO|nr:hypothetical protein SAMN05216355_102113 [Actinomyces ruminicola]
MSAASSRSRPRSLLLHRLVAESVDWSDRESWLPRVREGIARVRRSTQGEPHLANLSRWEAWAESGDTAVMREYMCATDEDACRLREVSPIAGFLTDAQRLAVIRWEREQLHGFFMDGVAETTAVLPAGRRDRLVRVSGPATALAGTSVENVGWCLSPEDLCVARLCANRDKDRVFVGALLDAGPVDPETVQDAKTAARSRRAAE